MEVYFVNTVEMVGAVTQLVIQIPQNIRHNTFSAMGTWITFHLNTTPITSTALTK